MPAYWLYVLVAYTAHSQPSYCLTIQYHPCGCFEWKIKYAGLQIDVMCWLHVPSTQSTLLLWDHSISYPLWLMINYAVFSLISCGESYPLNMYTVNHPTVWLFHITHCGLDRFTVPARNMVSFSEYSFTVLVHV